MFETPENFMMLSGLDPSNRWVEMSKLVPLDMIEEKLARPPKNMALYAQQCREVRRSVCERNEVEGNFGTGKRYYGLDGLTARLKDTSETQIQIHMIVLTMNLWKKMKSSFDLFLGLLNLNLLCLTNNRINDYTLNEV